MVLATIIHELGDYPTALVDLVGPDGVSHHTVLGVREHGTWVAYDVTYNLLAQSLAQSAKDHASGQPYPFRPVYRPYPRAYHRIIQRNFYLELVALWLPGLRQ